MRVMRRSLQGEDKPRPYYGRAWQGAAWHSRGEACPRPGWGGRPAAGWCDGWRDEWWLQAKA
jgi:hypothetical protein